MISYVSPPVSLFPTTYALVFGTRHGIREFAEDIQSLYVQGYFKNLIISGGATDGQPLTEARVIAQELMGRGIPENLLVLEHKATNTGQNVAFTREQVAALGITELLLIGKISSKRRYMMTIRKQWPEIRKLCCHGVNYFSCPAQRWWKDGEFRRRVISEHRKIASYIDKGFISEISISNGVVA